ncbi:hypothetical protein ACBI99_32580 [Nonomuraea sp. ATR24]|uniref:hypothetical protein n=1 Tax=Nonomuraea sp. ATR24 TaxID=1676744 RepID=UPI0035C005AD
MELQEVLAELAIRDRLRRGRIRYGRRTGPLVLQIEGGEAETRAWLEEFHRSYSGVAPVNEPADVPAAPKQVADELLDIAQGCGYDGRPAYHLPIVFPRFAVAYTVLVAWEPDESRRTRADLNAELEERVKQAIGEARRDVLRRVRQRFGGLTRDPYVEQQLGGLVGFVLRVAGACRFPHFRTVRWYRTKGFGTRPLRTTRVLIRELATWRKKEAHEQELLLVDAMLADIDAHYGLFRRLNRARRPVVLLPAVDRVPARRVIRDTLLAAYDGKSRGLRVHPVVIATSAPGGAPPPRGDNEPVAAGALAEAVPALFARRREVAEERSRDRDVPLPSRLLRVTLGAGAPARKQRVGRVGPVTAATVALAGAGLLGYAAFVVSGPESCGEGLELIGAECVGVSDGTDVFMPAVKGMREVFGRIEAENERIATAEHATVALMIPMESGIPAVREQILSEVQGAYLAQLRVNGPESAKPPIRLVLANPGNGYAHWRAAVDKLVTREPRLRVVAGFNLSLGDTRAAMAHLAQQGIPVVAGLVTSGDFANPESQNRAADPFPGLTRVVSTARQQADALLRADPALAGAGTALVADTRPGDNYNASLRQAFTEARKGRTGSGVQDMTFASPGLEEAGITPNKFADFALNLCQSNARFVYFAGRAFHLKLFIKTLAGTYCAGKKSYTVITGSDATTLASRLSDAERALLRGDPGVGRPAVSVEYAAPAHPDAWTAQGPDVPRYLAEPRQAMLELRESAAALGNVDLTDGRAIVTHDVILTAARELAKAVALYGTELPTTDQIKDGLPSLHAAYRIQGASGWICLTNAGNPYNKALPVVRLDAATGRPHLKTVAWPLGTPPENNCVVPQTTP